MGKKLALPGMQFVLGNGPVGSHLGAMAIVAEKPKKTTRRAKSMKRCLASVSAQSELSTEAGSARSNVKKNRYKDILPYDQTRVPLTLLMHEGYSDYINANFIRVRPSTVHTPAPHLDIQGGG
ncbi:tyrosine-protein phosphatase non-receptor type 18-like [Chiloscyllium plagiosum]|uniref:tyrosine-protein phosphatase non-receptor type 18-like n=1 Tax=Chiloscyllium plagiosum TaxID=36176 RepID=UPI001CB83A9F|nr:tyrosine-protein phosphatase non-receptor type 18-like [Chiloscyllium plagiosum]